MADVDVEVALMSFQSQEYARASMMYSDLELACQLQLNEALAASATMSNEAKAVRPEQSAKLATNARGPAAGGGGGGGRGRGEEGRGGDTGAGDKAIACAVQSRELRRRQQELLDQQKAVKAGRDVTVEMQRRWHDREFSKMISEMPEDEWENDGDNFEKPFLPGTSSSVGCEDGAQEGNSAKQECILYFAKAREDPGYVGMAWAVTDASTGQVLFQQSKFLGLNVSAYSADYTALINGLSYARSAGVRNIVAHGDSALVANQVRGQWRARSQPQVKFLEEVKEYEKELLDGFTVLHVPNDKNQYAINLARQAIQGHLEKLRKNGQQIPVQAKDEDVSEDCPICFERTPVDEMFSARSCSHRFCRNCLSQHVEVQVKENLVPVRCPMECSNHLELDQCQPYLPLNVVDAFARRLTEASIPEADRVYCPFKNCSALMSKGGLNLSSAGSSSGHPSIGRCECMVCHRLFCVECQVPWHVDLSCAKFQKLPPDERDPQDVKLHQLARNQNWQRCKKCKHLIELNTGCYHMTCKCGHEFCYTCGAEWKNKHATCKCKLWDENNIIEDDDVESDDDESEPEYESEPEDFNTAYNYYKTQICKHWRNGNCWSGDACNFAHGQGELRRVEYRYY